MDLIFLQKKLDKSENIVYASHGRRKKRQMGPVKNETLGFDILTDGKGLCNLCFGAWWKDVSAVSRASRSSKSKYPSYCFNNSVFYFLTKTFLEGPER
jgi:hypothetical protein